MSVYSNLLFSTGTAVAERFLYIPSIGFCIILAYFTMESLPLLLTTSSKYLLILGLGSFMLYFSAKTIARNHDWKNTNTLLQADVSKKNNCARLNYSFADLYFNGKKEDAQKKDSIRIACDYYLKAAAIYPKYFSAHNQIGTAYYYLEQYDSAVYFFYKSLLVQKNQLQVFKNISLALDSFQNKSETIGMRKKLIELNPDLAPLYFTLGLDYKAIGKIDSAKHYLEKALNLKPDFKKAKEALDEILNRY
jgi:tetratricopeptide (TPR) repeat protein